MTALLALAFAVASVQTGAAQAVSLARWIHADAEAPAEDYVRTAVDLPDGRVKEAWAYVYQFGGAGVFANGTRLEETTPDAFRKMGGSIKGVRVDFTSCVRPGRNVLAFRTRECVKGFRGMIMRGEVSFGDGRTVEFASGAASSRGTTARPDGDAWLSPDFDDSGWKPVREFGDAAYERWLQVGPFDRLYMTKAEYAAMVSRATKGYPAERLAAEPSSPEAKIVYHGTIPAVSVRGEALPPFVMSEVDLADNAFTGGRDRVLKNCREDGIRLLCVKRFTMDNFTCEDGGWDFTNLDLGMKTVLARDPDAYVYFYFRNGTDQIASWLRANPDECVGFAKKSDSKHQWNYHGNPMVPSFASRAYREKECGFILALGAFARTKGWGRRVVGIHCGWGGSGDGMPCGCLALPDTGKRMTEAFRRYLKAKYGTDEYDRAEVPDEVARAGSGAWVKDLADSRDRLVADYLDCYHREFADYIVGFGKSVKDAFPGALAGAYYGYTTLGYVPEGMTARYEEVLRSPYIDYLWGCDRGISDGLPRHLVSTFHRYGKLSSAECDDRNYRAYLPGQDCNPSGKKPSEMWNYCTPAESVANMTRHFGSALIDGRGNQFVDFGRNGVKWFDCEEFRAPLRKGIALWRRLFDQPPTSLSDVAVVVDPSQVWKCGYHADYPQNFFFEGSLVNAARKAIDFTGYSADTWALEDFLVATNDYRTVVFVNVTESTPDLARRIRARIGRSGVTSVWCYAPGLCTPAGYGEAAMRDLTGIRLAVRRESLPLVATGTDGTDYSLFVGGRISDPTKKKLANPRVHATDDAVEVIARYADDGSAAFVRKTLSDGSCAYFTGVPLVKSKAWAEIFAKAGCHAWTKPGFHVKASTGLVMVYSPGSALAASRWDDEALTDNIDISGRCTLLSPSGKTRNLSCDGPKTWFLNPENL